jgi:hypothetical protein
MSFNGDLDNLMSAGPTPNAISKIKNNHPKGWEPRIEYDPSTGGEFISSARSPIETNPDEIALLQEFQLDPEKWSITTLRRSKWQRWDGEWLESFRCGFVPKSL